MVVIPNIVAGKTVCINTAEAGNPHQLDGLNEQNAGLCCLAACCLGQPLQAKVYKKPEAHPMQGSGILGCTFKLMFKEQQGRGQ